MTQLHWYEVACGPFEAVVLAEIAGHAVALVREHPDLRSYTQPGDEPYAEPIDVPQLQQPGVKFFSVG